MAKKVVVPENAVDEKNKPKKKKRSKCCTCCIIVLVLFIVFLAASFGIGWYFGDMFTREFFDMSLGDVFGVLGDMYWADDEKVVERPFNDDDLDDFYKEIKRNIMLKEDADVDFEGALAAAIDSMLSETDNSRGAVAVKKSAANDYDYLVEGYDDGETDGESSSQIMDILSGMIVNALNRDNIDLERLDAYDEKNPDTDTYLFNLNDKQLAAFINSVIRIMLENADKLDDFKDYANIVDLPRSVALKQVVFSTVNDGDKIKATMAKVTVWIAMQSAAGQAATHFIEDAGMGWVAPLARGMCNVILPENLYVSISIPLYGDADAYININDMNDEERARAYKLVNKIMDGGDGDALTEMLNSLTEGLKPMLETAAEHMDFANANSGTITVDLLDTAIKMATEEMEGEPLTKADFLYVLKALMSDPDVQLDKLEPYMFRNRYLIDNKEVYIKGGDSSKTAIDYEEKFIKEIEDKYSLDFGNNTKLDAVLAMLGVSLDGSNNGEMGSQDLLGLIDAQKFNQSLDKPIKDLKLIVTDRMLGAAMSGQMNKVMAGDGGLSGMDLKLDALSFVKDPSKPQYLYATLAVEADMTGLFGSFGDDSMVAQLAVGLMPSRLLFTVTVDITRDRPAGMTKDGVKFVLNSCGDTDRALDTLKKLAPSLDLKSVSEQIETTFNDMLDQMYKMLDIQLVASTYEKVGGEWTGNSGALEMPDIFTVVTDMVLVDENGERVVSPEQLKNVLRGINDTSGVNLGDGIASSYKGFIDQVVDKYYLNPAQNDKLETLADLTDFMSAFDTSKFRVSGTDPNMYYMAHDKRTVNQLKPTMTGAELGALIKTQMGDDVAEYTIENVETGNNRLTVVLSINVGSLLPEDVKFLLTTDKLYVTASINMAVVEGDGSDGDPLRYKVDVALNSMNKTDYASTLDIVRFFQPDFAIESQVNEFGSILYDQMRSINDSFASDKGEQGGNDFFAFTESGLVMTDFYSFLASKMGVTFDENTTADDVKAAVQGMYARSSVPELSNDNNYVVSDIIYNSGSRMWNGGEFPTDEYSDYEFNGYLVKYVEEKLGHMTVEQTVVLDSSNKSTDAANARTWLGSRLDAALDADADYLAVTVSMKMDDFTVRDDDKGKNFLPLNQSVYGTLVYKFENDEFTLVGTVFNQMGAVEYRVLQKIMRLSPETEDDNKVTIKTIGNSTTTLLNRVAAARDLTFGGKYGDYGIGSFNSELKEGYEFQSFNNIL